MSMNLCVFTGVIGRMDETKYTGGENPRAVLRFSVAVKKDFKGADGNYATNWVSCTAFGKTAEHIGKYYKVGSGIEIQTHYDQQTYNDKNGEKKTSHGFIVDKVGFPSATKNNGNTSGSADNSVPNVDVPEGLEESLPWA